MENKLTKNQIALLAEILSQYCEDCDSSKTTGEMVDRIWVKIQAQNESLNK
jgi:hypothetical protein